MNTSLSSLQQSLQPLEPQLSVWSLRLGQLKPLDLRAGQRQNSKPFQGQGGRFCPGRVLALAVRKALDGIHRHLGTRWGLGAGELILRILVEVKF